MGYEIRTFTVFRRGEIAQETHAPELVNAPDEPQFFGVVFPSGKTVINWNTAAKSIAIFDSFEELDLVHGHPEYETEWVWG